MASSFKSYNTIFAIIGDNEDSIGKNLFIIFFIKSKDCWI